MNMLISKHARKSVGLLQLQLQLQTPVEGCVPVNLPCICPSLGWVMMDPCIDYMMGRVALGRAKKNGPASNGRMLDMTR